MRSGSAAAYLGDFRLSFSKKLSDFIRNSGIIISFCKSVDLISIPNPKSDQVNRCQPGFKKYQAMRCSIRKGCGAEHRCSKNGDGRASFYAANAAKENRGFLLRSVRAIMPDYQHVRSVFT